jgi:hypothetical protein
MIRVLVALALLFSAPALADVDTVARGLAVRAKDASNITTGTIDLARIPTTVPRLITNNDTNFGWFTNITSGAPRMDNVGSTSGLGFTFFGTVRAANYVHFISPASPGNIHTADGSFISGPGRGTDGPGNADIAHFFGCEKDSALTSNVAGEVDCQYIVARNGHKGDTSAILGGTYKVRTGAADETGASIGFELEASITDESGTKTQEVHTLSPFLEGSGGPSSGKGYGFYAETFTGEAYSAYHASTVSGASGFEFILTGLTSRLAANQYFGVRGDKVTGVQAKGDIVQGDCPNCKTIRTTAGGVFQVRNAADDTSLLTITDAGVVDAPVSLSIGGSDVSGAWASFTPSYSCGAGSITTATASGRYKTIGKVTHIYLSLVITTLGTCATSITLGLPTAAVGNGVLAGRDSSTGKMLSGSLSGSNAIVVDYSNGFPFLSGTTVTLSGTYERT